MNTGPSGSGLNSGRRPNWAAFTIALGLGAFGGLLLFDAAFLRVGGGYAGVGPAAMPRLVGSGLVLLAVLTAITGFRGGPQPVPKQKLGPVAWICSGLLLQILLLKPLGFSLTAAMLFAFTAAAFGKRNLAFTLPLGLVFAVSIYAVFDKVLKLNLPASWLETVIFGG